MVIPAMAERHFQLNEYCSTGVSPRGAHVRTRWGRDLKRLSATNTMVRRSCWAFFLTPATAPVSNAGWLTRCAGELDRWVFGNSNPRRAKFATHAQDEASDQFVAQSSRPPARSSTARCHSPVPRGLL